MQDLSEEGTWESSAVMNVYSGCPYSTKESFQNNNPELRIRGEWSTEVRSIWSNLLLTIWMHKQRSRKQTLQWQLSVLFDE